MFMFDQNNKDVTILLTSYLDLKPGSKADYPITPDPQVDVVMAGKIYLANDHSDTKCWGCISCPKQKTV